MTTEQDKIISDLKLYMSAMGKELAKRQLGQPVNSGKDSPVSDHAVIRYLERVKGIDIEAIRLEILPANRASMLKAGAGRITCHGYELICANARVITVMKSGQVRRD